MATLVTNPVYKDTYYTSTATSVNFKIELDGETIFSGKAVRYPDADNVQININKVCRNYLESDITEILSAMPTSVMTLEQPNAMRTFKFYDGDSNPYDYRFFQDYSYDGKNWNTTSNVNDAGAAINGHYTTGMIKLHTVYRMATGTSMTITQAIIEPTRGLGYSTFVKCAQYALYYQNAYGGWDSFLIEGTALKKDSVSPYTTDRVYNNTTFQFETAKYVNEIKTSYELNTNMLNDEESERLAKHLLPSIKVYLHNLSEGWVKPVIINDNSITHQTYTTNGMKLSQYKINITESQSKIRR